MKNIKRIVCVLISAILLAASLIYMPAAAKKSEPFEGLRRISYQISLSDLENYADGGRAGLEIMIRSGLPDEVSYEIKIEERICVLTIFFEFSGAEEYRTKVIGLCGNDTVVISSADGGVLIFESADAMDYLDFTFESEGYAEEGAESEDGENETSIFDIRHMMRVVDNYLLVNEAEYQIEGAVDIRPEISAEEKVLADYLSIHTEGKKNGNYRRTVEVVIYDDTDGEAEAYFKTLLKKAGKVKTEEVSSYEKKLSVTFEVYGLDELAKETSKCLGCIVIQYESIYPVDSKKIGVSNQEYFDLGSVIKNTENYRYTFSPPSFFGEIETVEGYSYMTEDGIASDREIIAYSYQKNFCFDEIYVYTDLSNVLGKIERTICLRVSEKTADYYHEIIKDQLAERLPMNSVMTIGKDDNGEYFEIKFSSFSAKKVSDFTNSVLDTSNDLTYKRGFLGLSNKYIETLSFDEVLKSVSPADSVRIEYKLISTASLSEKMSDYDGEYKLDGTSFLWCADDSNEIEIMYSGINILQIVLLSVVLIFIGFIVVLCIKKRKKTKESSIIE